MAFIRNYNQARDFESNLQSSNGTNQTEKKTDKKTEKSSLIILCPKCQTKFSVSSEVISELELPRFHCSRCDNVFDLDPQNASGFEESDMNKKNAAAGSEISAVSAVKELPEQKKDEAGSTMEITKEQLSKVSQALNLASASHSSFAAAAAETTSIEKREISSALSGAKRSIDLAGAQMPDGDPFDNPKTFDKKPEPAAKEPSQLTMDLTSTESMPRRGGGELPYGMSFGEADKSLLEPESEDKKHKTFAFGVQYSPYEPGESLRNNPSALTTRSGPLRSGWQAMPVFIMPILFALFCASLLSFAIIRSPQLAESFAGSIGISMPRVAPPGLYLERIKFSPHTLENGERIFAVSGTIKNDSDKEFKDVVLEGFAFDKEGKIIAAAKTTASSGLDPATVKSMSKEEILSAQGAGSKKRFELTAHSDKEFLVGFHAPADSKDLARAEFFSARIYSVY